MTSCCSPGNQAAQTAASFAHTRKKLEGTLVCMYLCWGV